LPADAVLVPGGGLLPDGRPPPWVVARLELALARAGDGLVIALSGGTVHRPPPLDAEGFPITEAGASAAWLVAHGLDPRRIATETSSHDTVGNAFFSRVIHAEPRGFKRLLVITNRFHAERVEAIFRWVYELDGGACEIEVESVEDRGMNAEVLAARVAKERDSLVALRGLMSRIDSLGGLHEWIYAEHAAYAVGARPARASGRILESY
jgi:hypothetical protein